MAITSHAQAMKILADAAAKKAARTEKSTEKADKGSTEEKPDEKAGK